MSRMADVFLALLRTLANLRQGRIWGYVLLPALFSLLISVGLALWVLGTVVESMLEYPPMSFLVSWGLIWLAHILAYLGGWMAIFAFAYLCASLISAIFILPLMLRHLARTEYADLAPLGTDSLLAATVNSLWATLFFIIGWVLTLPLWLIPGLSLILPMLLMASLNRRTFAYDALSLHATDDEWQALRRQHKGPMFMLGLTMAMLAHLPFIGLLVPALAALAFVHYGLEALRRQRGGALVSIEGEQT